MDPSSADVGCETRSHFEVDAFQLAVTMSCGAPFGVVVSSKRSNQMVPSESKVGYSLNHVLVPSLEGATVVDADHVFPDRLMTLMLDVSVLFDVSSTYASSVPSADQAGLPTESKLPLTTPVGVGAPLAAGSSTTS